MNVILGGGLAGLAAGAWLTNAGHKVTVLEKDADVGGLARTFSHDNFRFDLGGHRFLTGNRRLQAFVEDILGEDLLTVPRKSRIFLHGKHIDYPLSPANAVFGTGFTKTGAILLDYGKEKIRNVIHPRQIRSLEDWVVSQFGRTIFNLYFKDYSEKVWGIDCRQISRDWVAQRIDGLSLWKFMMHSLVRFRCRRIKTLTDTFLYPRLGIGQLPDRLADIVKSSNTVQTGTGVDRIFHADRRITGIQLAEGGSSRKLQGERYISSIPVTTLITNLDPAPPQSVNRAAAGIRFRSLVVVALFTRKKSLTDLSWMYFPGKDIPFGRIHEPKNWSGEMAPQDESHVIAEYFCNQGDATWLSQDHTLADRTARHLERLGFFAQSDLIDGKVLRVPYAYPVFDLEYQKHLQVILDYLAGFANLHLVGRNGMFSYLNMDQAMESGIHAAEKIIQAGVETAAQETREALLPFDLQPDCSG